MADKAPAMPVTMAEMPKAVALYMAMLMPIERAAIGLSRIAIMARPVRLRTSAVHSR